MRNMVTPFKGSGNLLEQACPMNEILGHIAAQLAECKMLQERKGEPRADRH